MLTKEKVAKSDGVKVEMWNGQERGENFEIEGVEYTAPATITLRIETLEEGYILGIETDGQIVFEERFDYKQGLEALSECLHTRGYEDVDRYICENIKNTVKVVDIIKQRNDYPLDGESYIVGKTEDGRYFFSWGWSYPEQEELPEEEVANGVDGFKYYQTEDEAFGAMTEAIEARESSK